jgi:pyrroloquinoline quinone biosynthesis protein B
MRTFIESNGPWNQLTLLKNIDLRGISAGAEIRLSPDLSITAIEVPHRGEYSETAGYLITGRKKQILYIPDIDKWDSWNVDLRDLLNRVEIALLDGTFFDGREVSGRSLAEIPHPFVTET